MAAEEVADSVCLVVPCFNENARLHVDHIRLLVDDRRVSLVLVDDGSSDATLSLLRSIEHDVARVDVVALGSNRGKGEAVRAGLAAAMATGAHWVGYVDADMSTPPSEVHRLIDVAVASPHVDVVLGSRVALLGRDLRRSPFRHYTGRVFATLASLILAKPVYDTQCGAK
ncbi:MAG: glycosyl transferase family 2, partial [Ilumatobacteraceae bacterium]|nr:glycosyl transferase family 2 [Ilumatobacteraceae bacterium]